MARSSIGPRRRQNKSALFSEDNALAKGKIFFLSISLIFADIFIHGLSLRQAIQRDR